jgi:hypothetical protein
VHSQLFAATQAIACYGHGKCRYKRYSRFSTIPKAHPGFRQKLVISELSIAK